MTRLEKLASNALVERLTEGGLAASYDDASVSTGVNDLHITCLVEQIDNVVNEHYTSKVLFRAARDNALTVTISSNGSGKSEDESVLDAVSEYAKHVWPVFRAALGADEEQEEDEVEVKVKERKGLVDTARLTSLCDGKFIAWDVFLGPYRVEGARREALLAHIKKELPITLCMDSIASYLNERRVHWVEINLSRSFETVTGYVSIDNNQDTEALKSLVDFQWPNEANGHESFSQFVMLCPSDREVEESIQADLEQIRASVVNVEEILSCEDFSKFSQRELKRDLEILTGLLDKIAGTTDILKARAALYGALGEMENALADLSKAIEMESDNSSDPHARIDAYYRRALVQIDRGNFHEGEQDLETASSLDERDLRVRWGYAVLFMATQNYARAKDELDELISENNESDYLYYYRAVCSHHVGDFETAMSDLNCALAINPNYLDAYYERGHILSHMGEHDRALGDYSRLVLMAPDKPEYVEARAWEYDKLADHESALEQLKRAEAIAPDRPTLFELRARVLFKLGKYEEAIEAASKAIELLPSFAAAHDLKSEAFDKLSRFEEARAERVKAEEAWLQGDQPMRCPEVDWKEPESIKRVNLNQLSTLDPTENFARRGALYQDLGLHEKAVTQFDKGLKRDPLNSILLQARAASYEALGDWDRALGDATAVIGLEPEEEGHYYNRGAIYTQKGDLDKALDDFSAALKINPDHAQSYAGAAYAHMAGEDYFNAVKQYDRAIEISPAEADWYLSRAWCLQALDKFDLAIENLDEAISLDETFADAYYCRGFVRSRMKERDRALQDFNTAIDYASDCSEYFVSRAWEHYKIGDLEASERDCHRAIDLDPEDPAPYDTLSRIKLASGKTDEALKLALEGVDIAPDYPDIYDALSRCYEKLGKKAKARQAREKSIMLGFTEEED